MCRGFIAEGIYKGNSLDIFVKEIPISVESKKI
jgi:hypothetical protein